MDVKACGACGEIKSLDQFYVRKDSGKLTGECRTCKQARSKVYFEENKEDHHKYNAERYRTFARFARYGLTKDQYDTLLERQGDKCALCGTADPGGKGVWHIDHGHSESDPDPKKSFKVCDAHAVRGLLCHACNVTIGHYEAIIRKLGENKVLDYLTRPMFLPEALVPPPKVLKNSGVCKIAGCTDPAKSMAMCASHYRRHKLYGDAAAEFKSHDEYQVRGASHGLSKLNEELVREIKRSRDKGVVLAKRYGVSTAVISAIRCGRTWTHVDA